MKKTTMTIAAAALLGMLPATLAAQGTGGLPPQVRQQMQAAMNDLQNQDLVTTTESLAESVGKEKLDAFLAGAVAKIALHPDGSYDCYTLAGGELEALSLGKQELVPAGEATLEESWTKRSGAFEPARRPQPVKLTLKAGPQEVEVACHNKYQKTDRTVTYYVGPLDGLFCMGLADSEEEDEEAAG